MREPPVIAAGPSAFVGRTQALADIRHALSTGARVVTLLGPGGMGKTRTARRFMELHQDEARTTGGAWFCDLTEAREDGDVWRALAQVLDVPTLPASSTEVHSSIVRALCDRGPTLLVLDNFEQLVPKGCGVVARLAREAPALRSIVTSRERLAIEGEVALELPPLDAESDAVELFVARARAVGADPRTLRDRGAITALVRTLDGIPLAIELAAARSRVMDPGELLARMAQRFELLSLGTRGTGHDRHATLRRAIESSWDALTTHERSALAQCAVFSGGFSVEAAEGVLELFADAPKVMDVVSTLRDKSLVRQDEEAGRLSLYVSIRDLAEEKLATLDAECVTRDRHARWFAAASRPRSIDHALRGDVRALRWLSAEKENLLAAFRHVSMASLLPAQPAHASALVDLALGLEPAMSTHGPFDELNAMLDFALQAAATSPDRARALRLRLVRGDSRGRRGATTESVAELRAVLQEAETLDDRLLHGEVLVLLGTRLRQHGQHQDAFAHHQRAHVLITGSHTRIEALNLASMGRLFADFGRPEEARDHDLRALSVARALPDLLLQGIALANLAHLDHEVGQLADARAHYAQAQQAFQAAGDAAYEAIYRGHLGDVAHEEGKLDEAEALYRASIDDCARMRIPRAEGLFRAALAAIDARRGKLDEAVRGLDLATSLLTSVADRTVMVALEAHRTHLQAARGTPTEELRARLQSLRSAASSTLPVEARCALRIAQTAFTGEPLCIAADASWFELPGRDRVDLARKGAVRRVLSGLLEQHRARNPRALDVDALLRCGWPGERVLPEAGGKRVRVAIATLRRLGLDRCIVTRDGGYLLDPAVPVRVLA